MSACWPGDRSGHASAGSAGVAVLIVYGACAVTFTLLTCALERRGSGFVAAFACGAALPSRSWFLAGPLPFGVVEAIWTLVALRRHLTLRRSL